MVRAVGLFIAICVLCGTGSSQLVPDGQVYTEVKKTLVLGSPGVLTCRFLGDPIAVFWEKGNGPDDLELMLMWHNSKVSGPRYDDRSCDIDENYSLIISNVSTEDTGRIYCTVWNYRGIVINNYTDVSAADTAIETKSEEILRMGQGTCGVLKCTVRIKASKISWKKGNTSPANETLVVLENDENQAARSGFGYDEGMYNITEDYSLIIKNVQVHHEGLYVCEMTDFDTESSFQNNTFVNVIAHPPEPFPTIKECMNTEQNDSQYCTLDMLDGKSEMTLTCQVMEYYPEINLFFLHGSKVVEPSEKMERNNTDGTKNKTVTIAARGSKELYTCVASNIPGSNGRSTTSVLLQQVQDEDTFNSILTIVLVCFAALILLSLMAYFIWRKRRRHSDSNHDGSTQAREEGRQIIQGEVTLPLNGVISNGNVPSDDGEVTLPLNGVISNGNVSSDDAHQTSQLSNVSKTSKSSKKQDENVERGNWSNHLDFILSCVSYAVGLGNVWRFPYLCYSNGGGAFLIPYIVMLLFAGLPLFFLELCFGQYSSSGPISAWRSAPLMKGVGFDMVAVSAWVAIYYNVIITYTIFYIFKSMTSSLPWIGCHHEWNTPFCSELVEECLQEGGVMTWNNTYVNVTTLSSEDMHEYNITSDGNITVSFNDPLKELRRCPSEEYYRDVLIVPILNCATSIFAGFVIFSIMGYMAHMLHKPVSEVVDEQFGLAFIAYPEAVARLPISPLWALVFFFMLITLGLGSQLCIVETVVTSIADEFNLRKRKIFVLGGYCTLAFFLGLICVTQIEWE